MLGKERCSDDKSSAVDRTVCRVGYTVTKKVGGAVIRNRQRRRLREVVRILLPELAMENFDYVVIARNSCPQSSYKAIMDDLQKAFVEIAALHRKRKQKSGKSDKLLDHEDNVVTDKNCCSTVSVKHATAVSSELDCNTDENSFIPLNLNVYG